MKLKKAIRIAQDCGLSTFAEMQLNIEAHCMNLFVYTEVEKELTELQLDLEKLAEEYGTDVDTLLGWEIKEIEHDI